MPEKISTQEKIKFLEYELSKLCHQHNKQAIKYCGKLDCRASPYICAYCKKESQHGHFDQLYDPAAFIHKFYDLIESRKARNNKQALIFNHDAEQNYIQVIKELTKVVEQLQQLERKIVAAIDKQRQRVQQEIDKRNKFLKSKSKYKIHLYANPNLLVNKINVDSDFILEAKDILAAEETEPNQNAEIKLIKNEVASLKQKIREMVGSSEENTNISTVQTSELPQYKRMNTMKMSIFCQQFLRVLSLDSEPLRIFSNEAMNVISFRKDSQLFRIADNTIEKICDGPIHKISFSEVNLDSFVAISHQISNILLVRNQHRFDSVSLNVKISSLFYLDIADRAYALIGQQNGTFNALNLEKDRFVYSHQGSKKTIRMIECCQALGKIFCLTEESILIYRFGFNNQEIIFDHQSELELQMKGIRMIRVTGKELLALGSCRNILLYDLLLKCQILRTSFKEKAPPFTTVEVLDDNLLTHCHGESCLYGWIINRPKKSVQVDPIYFQGGEAEITGFSIGKDWEVSLLREGKKSAQQYLFYLEEK